MSVQRVPSIVLLLATGLATCAVHCARFPPGRGIPPRCRELSVTPVSCADSQLADSLLPHPDDCELFYYCVTPAARPVCRQCPARLHFNPRLRVCDHPARAGCTAPRPTDGAPEPPATDGTTTEVPPDGTAPTEWEDAVETTTAAA